MTSIELIEKKEHLEEKRNLLLDEIEAINDKSVEEERELTEKEKKEVSDKFKSAEGVKEQMRSLDEDIKIAKSLEERKAQKAKTQAKNNKSPEDKLMDSVSVTRALQLLVSKKPLDGAELEITQEAREESRNFDGHVGDFAVPSSYLEKRTDIDQTTSAIQPTEVGAFVDGLREDAVWEKIGCTVHNGLTADFKIPLVGAHNVAWASAENSAASDIGANFTSVTLNPIRITGYVDISNRVILQNGQAAVNSVMRDLGRGVANVMSDAMFSTSDVTNAPGSLGGQTGIGTFTEATYSANASILSDLVEAEMTLADAEGLRGNLAYVLSTKLLNDLKKSAQVASVIPAMTGQNAGTANINGYTSVFTTSCSTATGSGDGYFGDFSHWHIGFFGGMGISVDPYSSSLSDQIRLVVHRNVDWDATRPAAFVKFTSLTA